MVIGRESSGRRDKEEGKGRKKKEKKRGEGEGGRGVDTGEKGNEHRRRTTTRSVNGLGGPVTIVFLSHEVGSSRRGPPSSSPPTQSGGRWPHVHDQAPSSPGRQPVPPCHCFISHGRARGLASFDQSLRLEEATYAVHRRISSPSEENKHMVNYFSASSKLL